MHHIDEHTIELYVLGSELVKDRREEIEAHLEKCCGCRSLADQMEAFYHQAEEELGAHTQPDKEMRTALVRAHTTLEPYYEPFVPPVPYRPNAFIGKFSYFVRRHPVTAGVGSFTMMAILALMIFLIPNKKSTDKNPSYPILDPVSGSLAIYNKDHDMLWSIPSIILTGANTDQLLPWYKFINIFDINEDGRNEIITALPLGNQNDYTDTLRIISAEKEILFQKTFDKEIQFLGTHYNKHWTISDIYCGKVETNEESEIFVLTNNGRSPYILVRLNKEGDVIGNYVHYGAQRMFVMENRAREKEIFLCGQNDIGEKDSLGYPVLIVLDPEKINGKTESSCTPGFGLETSKAEQYYIKFPLTDLNYIWKANGCSEKISVIQFNNNNAYDIVVGGSYNSNPIFEYILSDDMGVLDVKYSSETLKLRQKLIADGKIKGTFSNAYLDNLKNGVRYWDGKEWRKEVTMVNHSVVDGHQTVARLP